MSGASDARRWGLPRSALARGALFLLLGALLQIALGLGRDGSDETVIVLDASDIDSLEGAFGERHGFAPDAELRARLIGQEIDDRLLVAEARRRGWHRSDPVVQRRLIQNQRFLGADEATNDAELLDLAYAQGMDRTDVVVKRRLMERVRLAVAEASRRQTPTAVELEAYREAHADLFRQPGRVSISQVFLSRDRRGDALRSDAQAMAVRITADTPSAEEALGWADPSLLPQTLSGASEADLARQFGADFARVAHAAPVGVWTGPIASTFGQHFVWLSERTPPIDPVLAQIEASVRARVQREREAEALLQLLQQLRSEAVIEAPGWNGSP